MTHIHLDIWSPNINTFKLKLVDFGPNAAFNGPNQVDDSEHEIVRENVKESEWVSLDIPLTEFIGLKNKGNLAQIIFSGTPAGESTLYIDNLYFYNTTSSTNNLLSDKVKIFPNPVKSGDILRYEGEIENVEIYDIRGVKVLSSLETNSSEIQLDKGLFLMKVKTASGEIVTKKIVVQ
jgi:hypothetical protein